MYAKKSLFFLVGAGLPPYLFDRFRSLPKGTLGVVVFEPDLNVLIHTLCLTSVYLALPSGCHLAFASSPEREHMQEVLNVNIRPMGSYIVSDAEFIVHEGELEAFSDQFRSIRDAFAKEVRVQIDILGNSAEDTLLGFRQIVLNLLWLLSSPNLQEIGKAFYGFPFICVASGPSLEKNIHLLKGQEDKSIIISADTALRRLLSEGIRPHVVVTLERPIHTYTNYFKVLVEEYSEECKGILLVGQGVSPPQIFGRWPGPKIAVGKVEIPVDRWFISGILGGNIIRSGMSVAHMALMLSSIWGAKKIALVGQDLAFGEDGASHAGNTAAKSALDLEKKRGAEDNLEVPGALGGTVKTTNIWFLFLKVFETLIPESGCSVFDCTEGGALIKGTTVQPLEEYLARNSEDFFLETTPAQETRRAGLRMANAKEVLERIDFSLRQLDQCSLILDQMEKKVERATAPALAPEYRRKVAYDLSEDLDELNKLNPVLAFIGQSYANLSGVRIARSRWLETIEEIEAWRDVHLEIICAHRINVRYICQWSKYAKSLCSMVLAGSTWLGESTEELFSEVPAEKASGLFAGALEKMSLLSEIDRCGEEIASINLLISRSDAYLEPWSPEQRWQLALFLHGQGRAEQASSLMKDVASNFDEREMPLDVIVTFFKDFARVATTHDLCFIPQYRLAKLLLDNARRYAPEDFEIVEMTDTVLKNMDEYLSDLYNSGMIENPASIQARRILAERTLNKGELAETLNIIWSLILDFSKEEPDLVRPLADWLIVTLLRCLHAADSVLRHTVDTILTEIAENPQPLVGLNLHLPREFFAVLQKKGLQFSFQTPEKKI